MQVTLNSILITEYFTLMCLIVFSYKSHHKYPLILAANRDEFYDRPAREAHFWDTTPPLLAGKDLKAGGTWLGISTAGVMGAVTNYRDLNNPKTGKKSRGELITGLLTKKHPIESILQNYIRNGSEYSGFNMIAGSVENMYYISNIRNRIEKLNPGLFGISNAFLNTSWPKVDTAKNEFKDLTSTNTIDTDAVFDLLKSQHTYPESLLPKTGLSPEMEKKVSSIFIETENYGTRCSSLLMIDNNSEVTFIERTYPVKKSTSVIENKFQFKTE